VIQPVNRYIQILLPPPAIKTDDTTILLPADFKPQEERHVIATIKEWASDVRFAEQLFKDAQVIVDKAMVEEIVVNNEPITVVQDNYIIAILKK
jgi:hypothetical protein